MKKFNEFYAEGKIHPTKDVRFVRYGGLSPVKQKGYGSDTYHAPPARKGIYAFVFPYIEKFLIGASEYSGVSAKHGKFDWVKDRHGSRIDSNKVWKDEEAAGRLIKDQWGDDDIDRKRVAKQYGIKPSDLHWAEKDPKDDGYYYKRPQQRRIFKYNGEIWSHFGDRVKPKDILATKNDWILTSMETYKKALAKELGSRKIDKIRGEIPYAKDNLEVFIERL
jgi:hypothetical protein